MEYQRMELKVCEGCGALWLRANGSGAGSASASPDRNPAKRVYCNPCVRMLASFPDALGPKKNSRIRIRIRKPLAAQAQGGAQ